MLLGLCIVVGVAHAATVRTAGPFFGGLRGSTVTLTDDGRILIYTGDSASLWDPESRRWKVQQSLQQQPRRYLHTATAVNGNRVIFAGGLDVLGNRGQQTALASTTVWDAARDVWEAGPGLLAPRFAHAAVAMPGGGVLVTGGSTAADQDEPFGPLLATVELLEDKTTTTRAPMRMPRAHHTATLLKDGRVMVIGGIGDDRLPLAGVEIYEPRTNQWNAGPDLAVARTGHTANLLPDGRVLVAGGTDVAGNAVQLAEIWSPGSEQWQPAGELLSARTGHAATTLPDGSVLLSGGTGFGQERVASLELWSPTTSSWEPAGELPLVADDHRAVLGPDGSVLLFGRDLYAGQFVFAWLRDEQANLRLPSISLASLIQLADGRFLLAGGQRRQAASASATVYDPRTDRWMPVAPMHYARSGPRAVRLADGRVLVLGGEVPQARNPRGRAQEGQPIPAEVWDPQSNRWTLSSSQDFAETRQQRPPWRDAEPVPASIDLMEVHELDDGGVLAWKRPKQQEDLQQSMVRWRPGSGWETLPLPPQLTANASLQAGVTADGMLLLIVNGQQSLLWRAKEHEWLPITQDGPWENLVAIVNDSEGRTLAFHGVQLVGRSFGRLAVSWLNVEAGRWQPNTNDYVARDYPAVLALSDAKVMVAGGASAVAQIWSSKTNRWRYTGFLPAPLSSPVALKLHDGSVMIAGRVTNRDSTVLCALWEPTSEQWSPCGEFPSSAEFQRRQVVLRYLSQDQVLLVHGDEHALVREADGTWVATKLDFPKISGLPQASDQGMAYATDIASVWDPHGNQWLDATDVLLLNRHGMTGTVAPEGGAWVGTYGDRLLQWQPRDRSLFFISLGRLPEPDLDDFAFSKPNCVVLWNNNQEHSMQKSAGGYVPMIHGRNLDTKVWNTGEDLAVEPFHAGAVVLEDGSLLLAGRSRDDFSGGSDWQRFKTSCEQITALDPHRTLYLPTRAGKKSESKPSAASSSMPSAAAAQETSYFSTWKETVLNLMDTTRKHWESTLILGGLLVLVLIRLADRGSPYYLDESGYSPRRVIDITILLVSLCLPLLASGAPWPEVRAWAVFAGAAAAVIAARRLWNNIETLQNRRRLALPLGGCAALSAWMIGSLVTYQLVELIDRLRG
jgi:Kelch motif/Galactose oxidase, central domain